MARWAVPGRGDLLGGVTSAVVLFAIHGSYGVVALAPLGPAHAPTGFVMGVLAAAVVNLLTPLAGDRGPLISGPSAAIVLLVPRRWAVPLARRCCSPCAASAWHWPARCSTPSAGCAWAPPCATSRTRCSRATCSASPC
jgi:hypothetical protein